MFVFILGFSSLISYKSPTVEHVEKAAEENQEQASYRTRILQKDLTIDLTKLVKNACFGCEPVDVAPLSTYKAIQTLACSVSLQK